MKLSVPKTYLGMTLQKFHVVPHIIYFWQLLVSARSL